MRLKTTCSGHQNTTGPGNQCTMLAEVFWALAARRRVLGTYCAPGNQCTTPEHIEVRVRDECIDESMSESQCVLGTRTRWEWFDRKWHIFWTPSTLRSDESMSEPKRVLGTRTRWSWGKGCPMSMMGKRKQWFDRVWTVSPAWCCVTFVFVVFV